MRINNSKGLLTAFMLAVFVAAAMIQTAHAYEYTMANKTAVPITKVYMHLLTAFCKNKTWTGSIEANSSATISAQASCLVDSWEAWDSSGKHFGLSVPVGRMSETININGDGTMAIQ